MDMNKFCEKLIQDKDLGDIPMIYVFRVAIAVMEIINNGECFYDSEEAKCLSNTTQTPHP